MASGSRLTHCEHMEMRAVRVRAADLPKPTMPARTGEEPIANSGIQGGSFHVAIRRGIQHKFAASGIARS